MDDEALAAAAAGGDQAAFAELIGRYRRYVYTIAYKVLLHEEDALDTTQEVFAKVAQKIGSYGGKGKFRSWLAAVTVREALTLRRRPGSRHETPTDPAELNEARTRLESADDGRAAMTDRIDAGRRLQQVEQAMTELSPQQRAILTLMMREDVGPKAAAETLELGEGQVRTQLARALEKLRGLLGGKTPGARGETAKTERRRK